jgi:hypothetical protein
MALTTDQHAAITTDQVTHLALGSPIVLDLNGNGITTQSVSNGVKFDIFGVGQQVNTGWVSGGDGLLVMDRNADGAVNGGAELFGQGTTLANGAKAANGYAALTELDSNSDGVLNASDAEFSKLEVWVDTNSDGVSQSGELQSLASLGITSLSLQAQSSTTTDNGNLLGLVSNYTTADGATHEMADVWFQTNAAPSANSVAVAPPTLVPQLDLAVPLKPSDPAVLSVTPSVTVSAPPPTLTNTTAGLADALSSYISTSGTTVALSNAKLGQTQATAAAPPPLSQGVNSMVDALKQFDANGNALNAVPLVSAASVSIKLESDPLAKLASAPPLATGK